MVKNFVFGLMVYGCLAALSGGSVMAMQKYRPDRHRFGLNDNEGELCNFLKESVTSVKRSDQDFFDINKCRSFLKNTTGHEDYCSLLDITIPNEFFYLEAPLEDNKRPCVERLNRMLFASSGEAVGLLKSAGIDQNLLIDSFVNSSDFKNYTSEYLGTLLVIAFRGLNLGSFKALEFFGWHMSTLIARPKNRFEKFVELKQIANIQRFAADLIAFAYASNLHTVVDMIDDFEETFGVIHDIEELQDIGDERTEAYGSIIEWKKRTEK